ncbi:hypothetical protein [Actinoplanes subglobosus]|uniref:Uncharacterized protein n=1 Tax=Actinoplanes subglobosus TaxID=1547892 RepID=A0ABV8JA69_9ACTN
MNNTTEPTPVPITVWHVPAARVGETLSLPLAHRLIVTYTRGRQVILDLTVGEQLAAAADARHRRHTRHRSAREPDRPALTVATGADATAVMAGCPIRLAVVLPGVDFSVNQTLIAAADDAGLIYRDRVVAVHDDLTVHTDILVFTGR